jgi:hypothetical protein
MQEEKSPKNDFPHLFSNIFKGQRATANRNEASILKLL